MNLYLIHAKSHFYTMLIIPIGSSNMSALDISYESFTRIALKCSFLCLQYAYYACRPTATTFGSYIIIVAFPLSHTFSLFLSLSLSLSLSFMHSLMSTHFGLL